MIPIHVAAVVSRILLLLAQTALSGLARVDIDRHLGLARFGLACSEIAQLQSGLPAFRHRWHPNLVRDRAHHCEMCNIQ